MISRTDPMIYSFSSNASTLASSNCLLSRLA